jgi:hypothetical protein
VQVHKKSGGQQLDIRVRVEPIGSLSAHRSGRRRTQKARDILGILYVLRFAFPEGQVAQLVEHRTENAGVAGSIPALATTR